MSNILLESLACERPIITTNDNPGCMEVLREGKDGYGVKSDDLPSLVAALSKALDTSDLDVMRMGKYGRELITKCYDRKIVVATYIDVIERLISSNAK